MIKITLVVIAVLAVSTETTSRFEQLRKIYRSLCGQSVSEEQQSLAKQCDEDLPDLVTSNFAGCVRQVLKVKTVTKPLICYRGQKGGDQVGVNLLI